MKRNKKISRKMNENVENRVKKYQSLAFHRVIYPIRRVMCK